MCIRDRVSRAGRAFHPARDPARDDLRGAGVRPPGCRAGNGRASRPVAAAGPGEPALARGLLGGLQRAGTRGMAAQPGAHRCMSPNPLAARATSVRVGDPDALGRTTTMTAPKGDSTRADRRTREAAGSPWLMLAMATVGFAVNFWAWALISPLGPLFRTEGTLGALTESDVALLVAVPVIVGSLGRIAVGALTDKLGGRIMFPLISAATIIPVLFIGFLAQGSFLALLVGGFFLGIAGTAFAVGVPFVNAWFPPERRGLAVGVFGAGMGGTAISALTTVKLFNDVGSKAPFVITAAVLAA